MTAKIVHHSSREVDILAEKDTLPNPFNGDQMKRIGAEYLELGNVGFALTGVNGQLWERFAEVHADRGKVEARLIAESRRNDVYKIS